MLSLLLAVPSCIYSFWHGVIPTSYFIFKDFYTCFTNFLSRLSCSARRDDITRTYIVRACVLCARSKTEVVTYIVRACVLCARSKTEVVTFTCNQDKMASV